MKRFILFLGLIILGWQANAQNPIITGVVDACGSDGKFVELYVSGTVDFTNYKLVRRSNANDWASGQDIDVSSLGSRTDEFVYVCRDIATLGTEFPSAGISAANAIVNSSISHNGDDSYRLVEIAGDVVIDQFGGDTDGTGETWEYEDSWAFRNSGAVANGAFNESDWTIGVLDVLDNFGLCNDPANSVLEVEAASVGAYTPPATSSYCTPAAFPNGCGGGDEIDDFAIPNAGFSHLGTGCSTNTYGDFTSDPTLEIDLSQTVPYDFNMTHSFGGQWVVIWIDLNNDGTFDASERVFESTGGANPTSGTITIPATANIGTTRLRAITRWNSLPLDPCTPFPAGSAWGESHDYTVNILPPPACPQPINLALVSAQNDSVDVSWDAVAEADNGYSWEVYNQGDDPTAVPPVAQGNFPTGTTTGQAAGLNELTDYDLYLTSLCGADTSATSGPVSFTTAANCPEPETLSVDSVLEDGATISWTDPANAANGYQWSIYTSPSDPLTDTAIDSGVLPAGTNSDLFSGLLPQTDYDFYIDSDCGADGISTLTASITFTTACATFSAPFVESFDADSIPNCWSQDDVAGGPWDFNGFNWNTTGCSDSPSDHTGNGGNFAAVDFSGTDTAVVLETPDIDVSGLTVPYLEFYHFMCGSGYSPLNELYVEAFDGTSWNQVGLVNTGSASWELYGFDLSSFVYNTSLVKLRFRAESGGDSNDFYGDIAIDDVSVDEAPPCITPSNVTITSVFGSEADMSWDPIANATLGYNWEVYLQGDDPAVDPVVSSGTFPAGSNSGQLTGLTELTAYDVYLIANCDVDGFSGTAGPVGFTTIANCPEPGNLGASIITNNSATFTWDESFSASLGYDYEIYAQGDDPTVDAPLFTGAFPTGTNSGDVTGFTSNTAYDFYLTSNCDAVGTSTQAGPFSFSTLCDPFVAPYTEDFEAGTTTPNCWVQGPNNVDGWEFGTGETYTNIPPGTESPSGGNNAHIDDSNPDAEETIFTPFIDVSGLTNPAFSFYWTSGDLGIYLPVDFRVDIWDGAAWNNVFERTSASGTTTNGFEQVVVDLSTLSISGPVQARFISDEVEPGDFQDDIAIDDVTFGELPPPANDNACDATPLTVGAPSAGDAFTTVASTGEPNEPVPGCFFDGINGSVWFTFVAPASGDVTVTTDIAGGTLNDTEIAVYDAPGDCTDLSTFGADLGCDQDGGSIGDGWLSIASVSGLTPGNTYYIQVDTYSGFTTPGTFGIRVLDNNPPCPEPTNLSASGITSTTANLNWDDVTNATLGFNWEVYTSPSDPATDTPVDSGNVGAGVTTVNVSGLTPETDYDFYVSSDCDADGVSIIAGPVTFTTDCGPAGLNYEEDFTGFDGDINVALDCWNEGTGFFAVTENGGWDDQTFNDDASNDNGNGTAMYINLYNFGGFADHWTTSQSVDLGAGDPNYVLSYDVFVKPWSGNAQVTDMGLHKVTVVISTDGGATWDLVNTLATYDNGNIPNDLSNTLETISLAGYSGVVKFGFYAEEEGTTPDLSFYVDNIFVGTPPVCNEPTGLAVTNLTDTTVDFSWNDDASATGGYVWEIYQSGGIQGTDTPVDSGTTAAGMTMAQSTALTGGTDYDIYLGADCNADGTSSFAGPVTFTTGPTPTAVDCALGTPVNTTVCYDNNVDLQYSFVSTDGSPLRVTFIEGYFEDCCDDIIIYDGPSISDPVLFQSDTNFNDDATGIEATASGDSILVRIVSDGSVSCAEGSGSPALNFDVSCVPADELDYYNLQFPSNGTIALADQFDVFAQAYEAGLTDASDTPAAGIEAWIGYSTVDSNPNTTADWTWVLATPNPGFDFTQDNDEYTLNLGAEITDVGTYYYASRWRLNGGQYTYGGILPDGSNGGEWGTNGFVSGVLTVNPPVGDSCADPLIVGALPYSDANDTANFTDFYSGSPGTNCGSTSGYLGGNDVVYSYTATFDGAINVELTGIDNWSGVFMYADCADIGTSCLDGGVNGSGGGDIILNDVPVTNGTTYYFVVSTWPNPQTTPYTFNINQACNADAGTLLADATPVLLTGGVATISASEDIAPNVPAGYLVEYVLTEGTGLVIEQTNGLPTFDVTASGDYTIHTLVYDPNTFDITTITPGVTTGFDVDALLIQGGGTICGALDVVGAPITVQPSASAQIIHNSADPAAQFVDVYIDGNLALPNVEFRTATPYIDFIADAPALIEITPAGSATIVYNTTVTLTAGETYVIVASGVLDPTQFDSSVNTIDFNLEIFAGAQQASTNPGETSLLIHHGATDAPAVDAIEISVPAGPLAQDIAYPQFQGYVDVPTLDFLVNVETADNSGLVTTYSAPLATLGTSDLALTVVASGFLDPAANQNGAAFGLWAALPTGGALVELPVIAPATAAPDPTEDATDVISLFSNTYTNVTVDTFLTPWSQAQLNDVQVQGNDNKRYHGLDFAGIETVTSPVDASSMDFFHIDVWSPNATLFRIKLVNDLGGANQVEGELAFPIAAQQWVSLQIPLNDFADATLVTDPNNLLTGRDSLAQYIISGLPAGAVVAYVDNIYFSDDENISTVVFDKDNFSFYPSPAKNNLYLQSSQEVEEVKVFNMLGQEVINVLPNALTPTINVEPLQTGTYIMSVTINGETESFRFIKE